MPGTNSSLLAMMSIMNVYMSFHFKVTIAEYVRLHSDLFYITFCIQKEEKMNLKGGIKNNDF
jgi:hypothetical protein